MPAEFQTVLSIVTVIVLGAFSVATLFDKGRRDRSKLASEETQELISILQQKIKALEDRVTTTESDAKTAKEEAIKVKAENGTLREILQGRDAATIEFQKQAMEAMKVGYDTNKMAHENSLKLDAANKNIERLAKAIELHLSRQEKATKSS